MIYCCQTFIVWLFVLSARWALHRSNPTRSEQKVNQMRGRLKDNRMQFAMYSQIFQKVPRWIAAISIKTSKSSKFTSNTHSKYTSNIFKNTLFFEVFRFKNLSTHGFWQAEPGVVGVLPTESKRSCGKLSVGASPVKNQRLNQPAYTFFTSFLKISRNLNLIFWIFMQVFTPLLSSVFFTAAGDIFGSSKIEAWIPEFEKLETVLKESW